MNFNILCVIIKIYFMKGSNSMKKKLSVITAIIIALSVVLSSFSFAFAGNADAADAAKPAEKTYKYLTNPSVDPSKTSTAVVIPGVFQCRTLQYNEDGSVAKDSEGKEYSAPFFLESTGDIVKYALKKCLLPLLITLFTQHDFNHSLAQNVADTIGWAIGEKARHDQYGKPIYNVKADEYNDNVATLTQDEKDYIYSQIPLQDYANIVGEDHLYFFSYESLSNIDLITDELFALIQKAAKASPTGKTNIIPISQGGSLANDLLARHPEVGSLLDRIIYIVPALDGTVLLGEIYEKGIIDDDEALYSVMIPRLVSGGDTPWLGHFITIALRILPNSVVNDILDRAVDTLIGDYLKYCTTLWALVPHGNYKAAADKYLNQPEDAFIRKQTDAFYEAQVNSKKNIRYQMDTYGVEVFDICDYNSALYPIVDSWDKMNGDGVIQLDSTSIGATSVAVDVQLPTGYKPAISNKYIDKYALVDAGSGLLPDTTFYFHNQNHEKTANNDVIMKLAICLLTDKGFTSVDSYPDRYPQFNEERNGRNNDKKLAELRALDNGSLSAEDKAELYAAIAELEAQIDNTVVDREKFDAANRRCDAIRNKILGISTEKSLKDKISDKFNESLAESMKRTSDNLYKTLGGKGFSDIFRFTK